MGTLHQEDLRQASESAGKEHTADVLDILLVLAEERRLVLWLGISGFVLGAALAVLIRPTFTATSILLPPQQQSSSASLLNQLGSLASLAGGGSSGLGVKSPADMYVGILKSRTIADNLITSFNLQHEYKERTLQDTRQKLTSHTSIEVGKDGLIQISVTDHDPSRASDLTNAYVDQLYKTTSHLAITEAAQRRVFFNQQLDGEKKALANAEEDLRLTQQKTGLIQLSGQAEMIISSISQLRAQISSREVSLQALRTYSTDQNPEVIRLQEEIATMRGQLARLEDDQTRQPPTGDVSIPAGNIPRESLEYIRKYREVKYHESLLDLLSRQYEAARIDEAKAAPLIQVVDRAVPPDKRSGPSRLLIVLGTTFAGFVFPCIWILFLNGIKAMRKHPAYSARLHDLGQLFGRGL